MNTRKRTRRRRAEITDAQLAAIIRQRTGLDKLDPAMLAAGLHQLAAEIVDAARPDLIATIEAARASAHKLTPSERSFVDELRASAGLPPLEIDTKHKQS